MKQARRKELKTNELSIYLQQIKEAVTRNSNYILGGIVAVVLILMIGLYVQSSRHQAEAARWNELDELQKQVADGLKPETIERAERLAGETAGDSFLGPKARELHADLAYQRALDTSPVSNSEEYSRLLNQAKESYQKLIDSYGSVPSIVARGRLGLGSVNESLFVVNNDPASLEKVKTLYKEVIDSGKADKALTPYVEAAEMRLETLAERTRPLQIVATRPAEPVETAPAPLTTAPVIQFNPPATAPQQ